MFIDGIRALAALYVTIHHEVLQYYKIPTIYGFHFIKKNLLKFFLAGHYAVALFIVVSGFSLMISVTRHNHTLKDGALDFFKRRCIRILPPYYCAMLLSLLLIWTIIGHPTGFNWDNSLPVTGFDIVMHLLLLHDFLRPGAWHINHVFWSISVEWRIYFFFPLLVILWRRFGALTTVIFSVGLSLLGLGFLLVLSNYTPNVNFLEGVHPFIILFALGMLAADLSLSDKPRAVFVAARYRALPVWQRLALLLALLALAVYTGRMDGHEMLMMPVSDISAGLLFALILFALALEKSPRVSIAKRMVAWKPLVFVGTFSYSLYLIHAPLLQCLTQYVLAPLGRSVDVNMALLALVGTPLVIGAAYGFFYFFEKPFIQMNQRAKKIKLAVITDPAP